MGGQESFQERRVLFSGRQEPAVVAHRHRARVERVRYIRHDVVCHDALRLWRQSQLAALDLAVVQRRFPHDVSGGLGAALQRDDGSRMDAHAVRRRGGFGTGLPERRGVCAGECGGIPELCLPGDWEVHQTVFPLGLRPKHVWGGGDGSGRDLLCRGGHVQRGHERRDPTVPETAGRHHCGRGGDCRHQPGPPHVAGAAGVGQLVFWMAAGPGLVAPNPPAQ